MTEPLDPKTLEKLLRDELSDLDLQLSARQWEQLVAHFALLLRWSTKINLTSLRRPAEIARRHFGESLFLTKLLSLDKGLAVDVGSGAGFPALPLKVVWPRVRAILLEPNKKKAAFLKEVARTCGLQGVEIREERLEEAVDLGASASLVTMRAVAVSEPLMEDLRKILAPRGKIALFLGANDAAAAAKFPGFEWSPPIALPKSERRMILMGQT